MPGSIRGACARAQANQALIDRMRVLHQQTRAAYGARKMWQLLTREGLVCGRHRVARLRRLAGIVALRRQRYIRTVQVRQHETPPILNRLDQQFTVSAKNRVWAGDLTFVPTRTGWLTVAVLLDLYSRRVVGWAMSPRQTLSVVVEVWWMAWRRRHPAPGLIHHSDQGNQYRVTLYQTLLARRGVVVSMSRKGNCYDNAPVESFFSSLKNELVHHRQFQNQAEAQVAIVEYIERFYNRQRLHQALGYRSPEEFERQEPDSQFTCLLFRGHLKLTPCFRTVNGEGLAYIIPSNPEKTSARVSHNNFNQ
ncbi:MAG: IS3 family transposase [Nitrospira sp.]|nr:MAG: IS3 family transposase [Nitrospira sp.]